MSEGVDSIDRLVSLLGGWPEHFGAEEEKHGLSLLAQLRRDRVLDEAVFGMVVRYAIHRAAFDKLSAEIADQAFEATATNYLSGKEQSRAFHENKLLTLERELLATPYAREKTGGKAQTSFMDKLEEAMSGPDDDPGKKKVLPFQPMRKKGRR